MVHFLLGQIPDRTRARVPFDLQTFRFPALRFLWVYSTFMTHKNRRRIHITQYWILHELT